MSNESINAEEKQEPLSTSSSAVPDLSVKVISMADVPSLEVDWLWKPYIPFGKVTIIQGNPGEGKTTLALRLASACSRGKAFHEMEALIELLKQDIQIHAEQILLDEEKVRRDLLSRKTQEIDYEGVAKRQRLKDASKRMAELDQIIENLYEDRVTRKIPEEVFDRFFGRYENERKSLVALIDKIVVGDTHIEDGEKIRDIRIVYNFIGEVDSQ